MREGQEDNVWGCFGERETLYNRDRAIKGENSIAVMYVSIFSACQYGSGFNPDMEGYSQTGCCDLTLPAAFPEFPL